MKRFFRLLCLSCVLSGVVSVAACAWATEPNENPDYRAEMQSAFDSLADSASAEVERALEKKDSKAIGIQGFEIDGLPVSVDSAVGVQNSADVGKSKANIGVKVWFELADGTVASPNKKWRPKERFYIHIQAPVPLFVFLFQIDSETGESQTLYPSQKYENSLNALQVRGSIRLPVVVSLDDDGKDKTLSLVVVRSDWFGIYDEITQPAVKSVELRNGQAEVTAQLKDDAVGVIKSLASVVYSDKDAACEQIRKDAPELSEERAEEIAKEIAEIAHDVQFRAVSASQEDLIDPDDSDLEDVANAVCFTMLGTAEVGLWTYKITKDVKARGQSK